MLSNFLLINMYAILVVAGVAFVLVPLLIAISFMILLDYKLLYRLKGVWYGLCVTVSGFIAIDIAILLYTLFYPLLEAAIELVIK